MRRKLLTVATAAGLFLTAFSGQASASTYKVQSGDTLWKISQANKVTVDQLLQWNKLTSTTIFVGQTLTVAPTTTTAKTYTVKAGDSLWSIAIKNNMTVAQLKTLNNLKTDIIYVGQILKLSGTATTTAASTTTSTSKVNALVTEAKKHVGVPYVWGGSTPAGFDCSGYLNYVFNRVGVSIPRTVESIWSATKPVSSPKVGDLVFFTTYKAGPSHAGIFIGDNKFIHAGSSTGVTITDMNNSYWKARYLGARTAF